jgi:hypothetical protein
MILWIDHFVDAVLEIFKSPSSIFCIGLSLTSHLPDTTTKETVSGLQKANNSINAILHMIDLPSKT